MKYNGFYFWMFRSPMKKVLAEKYGKDKIIATVLPDRMERYFSTGLL